MSKIKKYDMKNGDILFLGAGGPTIRTYLAVLIGMGLKDKVILLDDKPVNPVDLQKLFDDDKLIQIPEKLRKEVEPQELEIISNLNEIFPRECAKVDPLVEETPWYARFDKPKKTYIGLANLRLRKKELGRNEFLVFL